MFHNQIYEVLWICGHTSAWVLGVTAAQVLGTVLSLREKMGLVTMFRDIKCFEFVTVLFILQGTQCSGALQKQLEDMICTSGTTYVLCLVTRNVNAFEKHPSLSFFHSFEDYL